MVRRISLALTLGIIVVAETSAHAQCDPRQEILRRGPMTSQWVMLVDQSADPEFTHQSALRGFKSVGPHLYDVVDRAGLLKNQVGAIVAFGEVGQKQLVAFYLSVPPHKVGQASKGYSRKEAYCEGTIYVASRSKDRVAAFAAQGDDRPWMSPFLDRKAIFVFWSTHTGPGAEHFQDNIVHAAGETAPGKRVREWLALSRLRGVSGTLHVSGDRFEAKFSARYDGAAPKYARALIRSMGIPVDVQRKGNVLEIWANDLTVDQVTHAVQRFP